MRNFTVVTHHEVLFCYQVKEGKGVGGIWERGEINTAFWWENLKESNDLEDISVDGTLILKYILKQ